MKIILCDLDESMVRAWQKVFGEDPNFEIHHQSILDFEADAIVSPANSFGFMNGGIDGVYTKFFGPKLQKELQNVIESNHHGELLVGEADWVPTGNEKIPYMISAPTMRTPMPIVGSKNAYLAFKAVLRVTSNMGFSSILCPGLGTLTGKLPPAECAQQMYEAYLFFLGQHHFPRTMKEAAANTFIEKTPLIAPY